MNIQEMNQSTPLLYQKREKRWIIQYIVYSPYTLCILCLIAIILFISCISLGSYMIYPRNVNFRRISLRFDKYQFVINPPLFEVHASVSFHSLKVVLNVYKGQLLCTFHELYILLYHRF